MTGDHEDDVHEDVDLRAVEIDLLGWRAAADCTRWSLEMAVVRAVTDHGFTWQEVGRPLRLSADEAHAAYGHLLDVEPEPEEEEMPALVSLFERRPGPGG